MYKKYLKVMINVGASIWNKVSLKVKHKEIVFIEEFYYCNVY